MNDDNEPNLVTSSKSRRVMIDSHAFSVEIYKSEGDLEWILEVVDETGTSHIWDDKFSSDKEAFAVAVADIEEHGALEFMRGGNVIPFPRN